MPNNIHSVWNAFLKDISPLQSSLQTLHAKCSLYYYYRRP